MLGFAVYPRVRTSGQPRPLGAPYSCAAGWQWESGDARVGPDVLGMLQVRGWGCWQIAAVFVVPGCVLLRKRVPARALALPPS